MPIWGIKQPETIAVSDKIRLRKFYASFDFTLPWYTDKETVYLVDGKRTAYNCERLGRMYKYLDSSGELYFIEYKFDDNFTPIGDVTLCRDDLPIVIGVKECRGKGIGKQTLLALIERARAIGFDRLYVKEIFDYNIASQKCFESVGFYQCEKTEQGSRYILDLS